MEVQALCGVWSDHFERYNRVGGSLLLTKIMRNILMAPNTIPTMSIIINCLIYIHALRIEVVNEMVYL